jgi:hypothetical protein
VPTAVRLVIEGLELTGHLDESPAGRALAARLPLAWSAQRWGHEYYGPLDQPVGEPAEEGRQEMAVGELAYHSESGLLCLFFGPTPMSHGDEPRAAFPVLPVGRLQGDWEALAALGPQAQGRLEAR